MKQEYKNIKVVKGLIILLTTILIMTACDSRLDEINNNPNAITEIPDDFLFATLARNTIRGDISRWQQDYGAQYAHQAVSNSWNKSIDQYQDFHMQGDIPEEIFRNTYWNTIKYANDIIRVNSEEGKVNEVRIAMTRILAIVNFAKLTDFFGDIPYFEGGLGKEEVYLPKYDTQEEIYADMVEQLKFQMEVLQDANPGDGYPEQDPIYNNDLQKWVKFANSFRLRLAMRARFADSDKYNPIIADCINQPLIEEMEESAGLEHQNSENSELYNPWYNKSIEYESGTFQYNVSEKFVNWLKQTKDPRIKALVKPNPDGEYIGMPNGLIDTEIGNYTRSMISVPGDLMLAPDQKLFILTASEIWFLRAEAAVYNIGTEGNPAALYQEGIKRNMERWNISATEMETYLSEEDEAKLSGDQKNQFQQIATQMWIAFVPNHQEAWNNIKRTGYPIINQRSEPNVSKGVTNGYLPKRLKYPYTVEKTLNGINLQEAIDRMGDDKIDNPVWWDVKD